MSELGQKLIELVREAAEERPDMCMNGGCVYVRNGQPRCLIGQALWKAGLINESFESTRNNTLILGAITSSLELALDQEELDWLRIAQSAQDTLHIWREAVQFADNPQGFFHE